MAWRGFAKLCSAVYVMQVYGVNTTMSVGPSMLPTFNERGDVMVTEFVSARLGDIRVGDVVVAHKPTDPRVHILKRVRAVGGESLSVKRNGAEETVTIPAGYVWLEGDNAAQSTDSRSYGPVPTALVRGRIVARCWPPRHAQWIERGAKPMQASSS